MSKKTPLPGGWLEHEVLSTLWDLGSARAREIHDRIGAPRKLVYTTIAKVLDRLHSKGLVRRERNGLAFVYRPRVKREALERARAKAALGRLLGSSPKPAIATLVDAMESIDPKLLEELQRQIDARRGTRHGS